MSEEVFGGESVKVSHAWVGVVFAAIIVGVSCLAIGYLYADNGCAARFEDWKQFGDHDWICTVEHAESCGFVPKNVCVNWCDQSIQYLVKNGTLARGGK